MEIIEIFTLKFLPKKIGALFQPKLKVDDLNDIFSFLFN